MALHSLTVYTTAIIRHLTAGHYQHAQIIFRTLGSFSLLIANILTIPSQEGQPSSYGVTMTVSFPMAVLEISGLSVT